MFIHILFLFLYYLPVPLLYPLPLFLDDPFPDRPGPPPLPPLFDLLIDLLVKLGDYLLQLAVSLLLEEGAGGLTPLLPLSVLLPLVVDNLLLKALILLADVPALALLTQ